MKVFSMNDCDWMAGESLESCKEKYLADFCGGQTEEEAFDDPHEVDDAAMDRMKFHDEGVTRTFREQLQKEIADGKSFPAFFASTEY